jgi:hypothetical protein
MRIPFTLALLVVFIRTVFADDDPNFNPITSPQPDDTLYAGQYFDIRWDNNTAAPISLLLFFWGTNNNWILADNIPNTGVFHWWVSNQIAYPTLVDTPYAGDPYWFEIHIYNGSFRQTIGSGADNYVGVADDVMKMNRGALWFNITAPIYSVQIFDVVTVNPTSFSTISGGTTETEPVTWSTVPSPTTSNGGTITQFSGSTVTGGKPKSNTVATTISGRLPTFAAVISGAVANGLFLATVFWSAICGVSVMAFLVL